MTDLQVSFSEEAQGYVLEAEGVSQTYASPQELFDAIVLAEPVPTSLRMPPISTVGDILFLTLFLRKDLALNPGMAYLVSVSRLAALGPPGRAHVDPELDDLLNYYRSYLSGRLSRKELGRRLKRVVDSLVDYIENFSIKSKLPLYPAPSFQVSTLNVGTGGFVEAETGTPLIELAWRELFRQGHLWGVLYAPDGVLVFARKGDWGPDPKVVEAALRAMQVPYENLGWAISIRSPLPRDKVRQLFLTLPLKELEPQSY